VGDDTSERVPGFPVTTTSVTATIGRPPRKFYFILQMTAFAVTVGLAFAMTRSEGLLEGKELQNVPVPVSTEILLQIGAFLKQPLGFSCGVALCLGLGLIAVKGAIDGFLKFLIWINVLWIIGVVGLTVLGLIQRWGGPLEKLGK
jgi:hypothetical protein